MSDCQRCADLEQQVASHCENRDSLRARIAELEGVLMGIGDSVLPCAGAGHFVAFIEAIVAGRRCV